MSLSEYLHELADPRRRKLLEQATAAAGVSKFDLAGRVYKGSPAPTNLVIPPYGYLSQERLVIGQERQEGA